MAVKQNNTDANGSSQNVTGSGAGAAAAAGNASQTGACSKGSGEVTIKVEQPGCSGGSGDAKHQPKMQGQSGEGGPKPHSQLSQLLQLINYWHENPTPLLREPEIVLLYKNIIEELARIHVPRNNPEHMKIFKADIVKIGEFFSQVNEKRIYMFFLNLVCQMISNVQEDSETPSCAIAIIFQLFDVAMIDEAVKSLMGRKVPDANIRCTVRVLCEWVRICNFCTHLNLWIMAILRGLLEQEKFMLFDEIALDNVDGIFTSMIIPVLRAKVSPILFTMLAHIHYTPEVFHKIIPRFPKVFHFLRKYAEGDDEQAEETKRINQLLVDVISALMLRFYDYGDLYKPVEAAMKGYQPSENYLNHLNTYKSHDEPADNSPMAINSNPRVGLVNLGNTCYMNSVLQALAMTKEFSREILLTDCKSPLLVKVQQQIALMLYSLRCELTPSCVLNATRPPGFSPGLQQDSSEFLGYLLETLHEHETAYYKRRGCGQPKERSPRAEEPACDDDGGGDSGATAIENTAEPMDLGEDGPAQPKAEKASTSVAQPPSSANSTIDKTFTGKLATTYKCLTCGWKSRNVDSFRDFQLSFPEVKSEGASNYSVQDLIDYYCSPEKLCGDNQYFCEKCKKLTDAERYINVITAPKNLILTLKHFKYDQKYHMRAKLMHKVFHDEKVSVKVCSSNSLDEVGTVHYDLYAGVVHSGFSMDSGHYYTYASDAENNWYKFNDNVVSLSKSEELHNLTPPNTPYILFYQMSARSNETHEAQASATVMNVEVPIPPTLEELPSELQDYVNRDNCRFTEEVRLRRMKQLQQAIPSYNARRDWDDEDDNQPPPSGGGGCGGNALNMNMNRFIC